MLNLEDVEDLLLQVTNFFNQRSHERYAEQYSGQSWYADRPFTPEEELDWNSLDGIEWDWDSYDAPVVLHGRKVEKVEFDTGGEGHGEDIHMVVKTTDVDGAEQYWRKDGYYASYDGSNWDGDFREVRPVEKVVVFYE